MKVCRFLSAAALSAAFLSIAIASPAAAQTESSGREARAIMTAVPKKSEEPPSIQPSDLKVKLDGRSTQLTSVTPLRGENAGLQLVILIDSGARESLARQMNDIVKFVRSLPPTTEIAIAYMMNGRAIFDQPLTTNKELALRALHMPGGTVGSSASPYFCISQLANHWPSHDMNVRREVVAITDGIDPYEVQFDPEDPYVRSAVRDAIRNGVVVDAIYWHDMGLASHISYLVSGGQSLLGIVTGETGGEFYYQGFGNPVSFQPYFRELSKRLDNQYELNFMVPAKVKQKYPTLKVKLMVPDMKMHTQHMVYVPKR